MNTQIKIKVVGGNQCQREKALRATEILLKVVNSEELRYRIISFVNKKGKLEFSNNLGLSNLEVYQMIMFGQEKLTPEKNHQWDFEVRFYTNRFSKVVGYTNPKITYINCNTKFFDKYTPEEVASNFAHEYLHKLGFDHKSALDHDSVPYAVGYMVKEVARELALV